MTSAKALRHGLIWDREGTSKGASRAGVKQVMARPGDVQCQVSDCVL